MLTPEQRAEISRANGAKSKGPVTPDRKESSSRNALKSGEHADRTLDFVQPNYAVAANEAPAVFEALLNDLAAAYPSTHAAAESIRPRHRHRPLDDRPSQHLHHQLLGPVHHPRRSRLVPPRSQRPHRHRTSQD